MLTLLLLYFNSSNFRTLWISFFKNKFSHFKKFLKNGCWSYILLNFLPKLFQNSAASNSFYHFTRFDWNKKVKYTIYKKRKYSRKKLLFILCASYFYKFLIIKQRKYICISCRFSIWKIKRKVKTEIVSQKIIELDINFEGF